LPITSSEKIIDANTLGGISKVSKNKCEILDWVFLAFDGTFCVAQEQYDRSPCKKYSHNCKRLEERISFSDEDAIAFLMDTNVYFERIAKDPWDLRIVYYAKNRHNTSVISGDVALLMMCKEFEIPRLCFKALMYHLHNAEKIFELDGEDFNFSILFDHTETNPFWSFQNNKRCQQCCGKKCNAAKYGYQQNILNN